MLCWGITLEQLSPVTEHIQRCQWSAWHDDLTMFTTLMQWWGQTVHCQCRWKLNSHVKLNQCNICSLCSWFSETLASLWVLLSAPPASEPRAAASCWAEGTSAGTQIKGEGFNLSAHWSAISDWCMVTLVSRVETCEPGMHWSGLRLCGWFTALNKTPHLKCRTQAVSDERDNALL